jgi:hypothetical protein
VTRSSPCFRLFATTFGLARTASQADSAGSIPVTRWESGRAGRKASEGSRHPLHRNPLQRKGFRHFYRSPSCPLSTSSTPKLPLRVPRLFHALRPGDLRRYLRNHRKRTTCSQDRTPASPLAAQETRARSVPQSGSSSSVPRAGVVCSRLTPMTGGRDRGVPLFGNA